MGESKSVCGASMTGFGTNPTAAGRFLKMLAYSDPRLPSHEGCVGIIVPSVGYVVILTGLDSEPHLLVTAVDEAGDGVTGVLLADLAEETVQRLNVLAGNHQRRQELTTAIRRAEDLMTFRVPISELHQRDSPATQGSESLTGGGR